MTEMTRHGSSAAALVCAFAFSLSLHARAEEHISDAEAASVLDHLLLEHDAVRMHRAAEVLDAVVSSLESPTGLAAEDKFPSERAQDEERVAAAVRALDEVRACGAPSHGSEHAECFDSRGPVLRCAVREHAVCGCSCPSKIF